MYKELVEYIVKCLVENKEEVEITENQEESKLTLYIKVATSDMGRVIGKEGRIIRGIREIVRAYSAREHKAVFVEIQEEKQGE